MAIFNSYVKLPEGIILSQICPGLWEIAQDIKTY